MAVSGAMPLPPIPNAETQSPSVVLPAKGRPDAPVTQPCVGRSKEIGGRDGPDPTRYGDWERSGRCVDF
jgi:hypothetical protein